jgi:hypothetical protein
MLLQATLMPEKMVMRTNVRHVTKASLISWLTNLQKSWAAMRTVGLVDVDALIMVKYFRDSRHEENCQVLSPSCHCVHISVIDNIVSNCNVTIK